jgi:hypothetical protein
MPTASTKLHNTTTQKTAIYILATVRTWNLTTASRPTPYIQTGSVAYPFLYPVGTVSLSLGVKWLEHESDHPSPSSTKGVELYLHSSIRLHGVVLKHSFNFHSTFTFRQMLKWQGHNVSACFPNFYLCVSFLNPLKPSGNYVPPALTINNSEFCPRNVFIGFTWFSE